MNAVVYLFQVSACMGIFYLFYYLLLSRYTFFTINRWYLIITLAISFIIPLLTITVQPQNTYPQVIQQVVYINQMQTPQQVVVADQAPVPVQIDWMALVKLIYTVAVAALFLRLMLMVIKFFTRIRNKKRTKIGGVLIVKGDEQLSNGSFFNYIFLNDDELSADELEQIIAHEMLHVKLYHSVDRILVKIAQVFLWFNPFVYLYARAIEENHEFEVDRAVSNSTDRNKYAELLFHLSVARQGTLYHSFSMVPLKKRITMLFTKPTNRMKKVIYLLVVPVVLISCLAFAKLKNESPAKTKTQASTEVLDSTATIKYKQKTKRTAAQIKADDESLRKLTAYLETPEGKKKMALSESITSKTINVIVMDDYLNKAGKLKGKWIKEKVKGDEFMLLTEYGQTKQLNSQLKKGDEIEINVFFAATGMNEPLTITPAYVIKDGKKIFQLAEAGKTPDYPFLYEANKVRFADGQITNIKQYPNGKWKTAVLERVNGYKFNLNFKPDAPNLNSIKDGDHVTLRFIHEEKTGDKTYNIKDWVAISTNIKDYGIKNQEWFSKFYEVISAKPIDTVKLSVIDYPERLQQITGVKIDGKDYPTDILYKIGKACIKSRDWKGTTMEITTKNGEITYQTPQDIANLKADYAQKNKFFSRILMKRDDGNAYHQVRIKRASGSYGMDDIVVNGKAAFIINDKIYTEAQFTRLFPTDIVDLGRSLAVGPPTKELTDRGFKLDGYSVVFEFSDASIRANKPGKTAAVVRPGIQIKGEVVYPGMYSVPERELTVAGILTRAGGLTPFGSPENVQVFKNGKGTKVNLSDKNLNAAKITIASVDSIYVPRVSSKVGKVPVKTGAIKTAPNFNDKPGQNLANTAASKAFPVKFSGNSGMGQYRSKSSGVKPEIGKAVTLTGGQSDYRGQTAFGFTAGGITKNKKSSFFSPYGANSPSNGVFQSTGSNGNPSNPNKETIPGGKDTASFAPGIKKMNGVEVRADGTLWVNNQPVKRALINGKEYMGGGVSQAVNALPAEIINKIEVTNNPAANGSSKPENVLNITTKPDKPQNTDMKKDLLNSVPRAKAAYNKANDSLVAARFSGKVTTVKDIMGKQLVIIKNGEYFAAYANLINLKVSPGQEIKTGQVLGVAAFNDEENKVAVHFELYRMQTPITDKTEQETIIKNFEAPKLNMITGFKNMYAYTLPQPNRPL